MYIFKRNIDKRTLIRYAIYAAFFILLATVVSLSAIWIKYKVLDFEAMMTEPEEREYSIYYNSLNHKQQLLYNSITSAGEKLWDESEVLRYSFNMEEFQKIIGCIRADRPELFYIDYDNLVLYHSNHRTKVGMVYLDTKDAIPGMIEQYNAAVDKALAGLVPSMTDYEKEIAVNDYLTDNCSYALGERKALSSTAYGALVLGQAYCDGYAYAAKQLFDKAYIDSLVVYGEANDVEHVWNMVEIEGQFYHLDVMWNDADIGSDSKLRFHGYFNLSDDMIKYDHSYENDGTLPYAVTDGGYYKQIGCYAKTKAELEEVFYNQLKRAVETGREYIELLCPETKSNEDIGTPYTAALTRVNSELGYEALYEAFSVYDATARDNSVTIQIYYN